MIQDFATSAMEFLCPGLPIADDAQKPLLAELVDQAKAIPNLEKTPFSAEDLARSLIHSRYLQGLARRHPGDIAPILCGNADKLITNACADLVKVGNEGGDETQFIAALRQLRQRSALAVALTDIAGTDDMATQMAWLSHTAETAVQASVQYLFKRAAERGLCAPQIANLEGCGWVILALGKLGAGELNFSSDIDLIILHDPVNNPLTDPQTAQKFYVEQTRSLVRLLSQSTSDGIGWRVDLRLRPDPGATAVSIQIDAALGYYESIARTWERAAFIRARPIAGDTALGNRFLADIQPFIWRRTLDYTVLDDMKSMLRRPPQPAGWLGYNLKSGKNGIRQIEFFTHVLQLVAGGRAPEIRLSDTLSALSALAERDWITPDQAMTLGGLYHGLRRVEHRLQMIGDTQTHSLPRGRDEMTLFARFLGHANADDLCEALAKVMAAVGTHTSHKLLDENIGGADDEIAQERDGVDQDAALLLDDHEQLEDWLTAHGFSRPTDISATLDGWLAGRIATTRGERARTLLKQLMPTILTNLAAGDAPDDQFAAFAQFVEGLPASVQIFSLLDHNRPLTRLLCDMLVLSPRMAAYLRRHPTLFDLVLFDDFFDPLPDASMLLTKLETAIEGQDIEAALDEIKRRTREWKFRAEVQALSRVLPTSGLNIALTAIADAVVRMVYRLACQDMRRRHGDIDGGSAVLALGRLGVGALTARSDLDLVMVYDVTDNAMSNGTRSIGASAYFARLTQTFVSWLSSASAEGSLYEVDMRLRPDGEKGSIAVSLGRFNDYYAEDAWLWEKLALAKGRIICAGPADTPVKERLEQAVTAIVGAKQPLHSVSMAIHDMRDRLRDNYGDAPSLQLRKLPGGLAELDLLIQGLRLVHADRFVGTGQSPFEIITTLQTANELSAEDANELETASLLFANVQNNLRLCLGNVSQNTESFSPAVLRFLMETNDVAEEAQLIATLDTLRQKVQALFDRIFPTKTAADPS